MKQKLLKLMCLLCVSMMGMSAWGQSYEELFSIASGSVVSNTSYQAYSKTVDSYDYVITFGGNNKSVGTNSTNRSRCNLTNYSKYAVSPVTTSSVASAFACTTELSDVSKISYTIKGSGSNQSNTNVYLLYSADNTTFSQLSLTSGTQGAAIVTDAEETAFEFSAKSGYFALLFVATNSSGNWRIDDVNLSFYKSSSAAATTTTINDANITNTDVYVNTAAGSLSASVAASGSSVAGATVTWSGDNDAVATIDANSGAVTLVGKGTVTFTASYAGDTDYAASSDTYEMTVTSSAPYVQPTTITASLNNSLFGTSYTGVVSGITDDAPISGTVENLKVTYAGAGNHYVNDSQIRFYPNNKLTFEAPDGYIITSIEFTAGTTWAATISANSGTYASDSKKWTGTESSVIFTGSGSSRCDMSEATINLVVAPSVETPTFSLAAGTYVSTQVELSTTTDGATIYYTIDGSTPTTSSNVYSSAISVSATTTLKAIAVKDGDESLVASATYTILQSEHAGTLADPFTIAEAESLFDAGISTSTDYFVTGIISQIDSYNSSYHSISYWISDDGTTTNQFECYGGLSFDGKGFTSKDNLTVGDVVTVKGKLYKYNTTYELNSNNELVSLKSALTVSASGYATYYNNGLAYTIPTGLTGYAVTAADGVNLTTTEYAAGTVVPAGEALVLKGAQGNYDLIFTTTDVAPNASNLLKGSDAAETPTADGKYYMLSYDATGANVGFYWGEDNGAAFENGAHKAYLLLPADTPVKGFRFDFDATAINSINAETANGAIYNLQGQQLAAPQKGINIVGGKKVLVK